MTIPHPTVSEADLESLVPDVAIALGVWDLMALELGDMAVVVDGHRLSRLIAVAALWYGALPVWLFAKSEVAAPGTRTVRMTGSDDQARELAAAMRAHAGVAAVEVSGTADAVDLLLESLPPSSRLLLAGEAREPLTLDYYVNVHRKGLRLVSSTLEQISHGAESSDRMERARRLLARPAIAASVRAVLEGHLIR